MKHAALVTALLFCIAACGGDSDGDGGGGDGSSGTDGGDSGQGGSSGGGGSGGASGDGGDGGGGGSGGSGGDDGGDAGPDGSTMGAGDAAVGETSATADITPDAGGSVTLGDIEVDVPAGAVSKTTTITIRILDPSDVAALPAGFEPVGPPVALLPHGLSFSEPVSITLGHSGTASDTLVLFRLDDEDDTTWEQLSGASFAASTVTVETTGFSVLCPGAESAAGDAGVDAGVDASTGGTDAGPGVGAVTGQVVDDFNGPLANVPVTIGSETVMTNAAGEFTITDAPATYDAMVINHDIVDTAVVYRGLTRRDPVFRFSRPEGTDHTATVTGTSAAPNVSNDESVAVLFGSKEVWRAAFSLQDGSFSVPLSWSGPASTMGTLHALHIQGTGFDRSYTAYGSVPLTVTSAGQQANVQMSPISTGTVSGTLTYPNGYSAGGREFFLQLDEHTHFHVTSQSSVSPDWIPVITPAVPGAQIQVRVTATDPDGGFTTAIRHVPTTANLVVDIPRRPHETSPDDMATGVAASTPLVWTHMGGPAGVSVLQIRAAGVWVTVVTTESSTTIPVIPGYEFGADTTVFWQVFDYAPFDDVDAFVDPAAPVDIPEFKRRYHARTDMNWAYTEQRRFQTPP